MHTSSSSFDRVITIHCLAALDRGAGVEQLIDCLISHHCQAVKSMGRSMDWTLEDNMVNSLFFSATLTEGHAAFV